ncbi:MAG: hypothetical protein WC341_08930, partial [Bacteroidales bacterium]
LFFTLAIWIIAGFGMDILAQDTVVSSSKSDSTVNIAEYGNSLHFNQSDTRRLPFQKLSSFGMMAASAYQAKGNNTYYYGMTSDGDNTYINGMQVRDASNFPVRLIDSYHLYTRQAPINRGFTVGGITTIETLNPDEFMVQLDINTDQAYNMQGTNGEIFVNIPFMSKKKHQGNQGVPGLLIAGKFATTNNTDPVWKKTQQLNNETLASLETNPLRPDGLGSGTFQNAAFIAEKDLVDQKVPDNSGGTGFYPYIQLSLPLLKTGMLQLGNYSTVDKTHVYNRRNSIFNSNRNALQTRRNFDNFINWKQQFKVNQDLSISYDLHLQYSSYHQTIGDPKHGKDFFDYGYLGKFTNFKMPIYEMGSVTIDSQAYNNVWILKSWDFDTLVTYKPSDISPDLAAYTSNYYDIYANQPEGHFQNMSQIFMNGGLLNGDQPQSVYGLFNNTGTFTSGYQETMNDKIRAQLQIHADYKMHHFTLGGEYNRETKSHYTLNPNGLWPMMRWMTNSHLLQLDESNPEIIMWNGMVDTINYLRKFDADSQTEFSKNLRQALGLPADGLEYILTDSYDKQTNTIDYYDKYGKRHTTNAPENLLSMDLFTASELLNGGLSLVNYAGYDYTGHKTSGNDPYSFFSDFSINASKPTYWSAFAQDEFIRENLHVNIGLRVDVYDANRPVLKDEYSLFEINTVADVLNQGTIEFTRPSNIGDSYLVYVDKEIDPTKVVGYRNGDQWFNASGLEIQDPTIFNVGSGIAPSLRNPEIQSLQGDWTPDMTFRDYKKTVNFMPQVNIDYTLIDRINFYVKYSSFTQNPTSYNNFHPDQYYYWNYYAQSQALDNPNLKPMMAERFFTGVKSRVWRNLVVDLAFLRTTIHHLISLKRFEGAYPSTYVTLYNDPLSVITNGFEGRVNYVSTTGTGFFGGLNATKLFTNDEYPLKITVSNLVINANAGYQFGSKNNFSGPSWANFKALYGLSATVYYQYRHGIPYIASGDAVGMSRIGVKHTPNINLFNLNIQKDIALGKKAMMNVYLTIENLFNFQNVFNVYSYTGKPDDDGFLTSPEYQLFIDNQLNPDSYRLLYQLQLYDPTFYGTPRIWRVGVIFRY